MIKLKQFIKKRKLFLATLIFLVVGGGYYATHREKPPQYETVSIQKGDVIQEVSVIGHVNSSDEVVLSFEKGGKVITEPVGVGMHVRKGDALVRIDASEILTLQAQAKANLNYEIAKLAELKSGTRPEDIAISKAKLESADSTLRDAQKTVFDRLRSAYTTADDGIRGKTDHFYTNPRTTHPMLNLPVLDTKLTGILEEERVAMEAILVDWGNKMNEWSDGTDLESAVIFVENAQESVKKYLDRLALAVNGISPSAQTSQTTIDGWQLDVSAARANLNTSISAVLAADQAYRSAQQAQKIATNELLLKEAGNTQESIMAQEARITATRATLANYDAQIAKTIIFAPFSGVVTKQNAKLGETITPNVPIVSLMSDGKFKIETNVPEVDIAKVKLGDKARITLDAYGSDVIFIADVATIDPAETIVEGVSTYKVTLFFSEPDERIRSGMTANIDISTDKRTGVLVLPSRAITTRDSQKIVRVLKDGQPKDVEVDIGLRGSDGNVEITKGLSEGDLVITFEKI